MAESHQDPLSTEIKLTNPRGVESVYVNNVQILVSNWDIRFLCTELMAAPGGGPEQQLRANLVMSIPHAKALLTALQNALDRSQQQSVEGIGAKRWIA
ncbi:MAG: hypothetical protein CXZ00_10470 [Acidobacteria bacterium]|nr:MAG: hypothetical protein CXZ00_10470 [Acidobacteriota bacterium]